MNEIYNSVLNAFKLFYKAFDAGIEAITNYFSSIDFWFSLYFDRTININNQKYAPNQQEIIDLFDQNINNARKITIESESFCLILDLVRIHCKINKTWSDYDERSYLNFIGAARENGTK